MPREVPGLEGEAMTKKKYIIKHKSGKFMTEHGRTSSITKAQRFDSFREARHVSLMMNQYWTFSNRRKHHREVPPYSVHEVLVTE